MTAIPQKRLGAWIKKMREEKGFTQEEVARHLNIKRQAVGQMEKGERGVDAIEATQLAALFSVSVDFLLNPSTQSVASRKTKMNMKVKNIPRVHLKFDPGKLKNLILYILDKCGGKPNFGETVLYKLLYFVDFDAYEILGKPITGTSYVKLQFGPAPKIKEFQNVVNTMVNNKELMIFHRDYHGKTQKRYIAFVEPDLRVFFGEEQAVMDKVLSRLSHMRAVEIEVYAHGDAPWRLSNNGDIIPYELVMERTVPYAHRDYDALWQDAGGYDALKEIGPVSDEEYAHYRKLAIKHAKGQAG